MIGSFGVYSRRVGLERRDPLPDPVLETPDKRPYITLDSSKVVFGPGVKENVSQRDRFVLSGGACREDVDTGADVGEDNRGEVIEVGLSGALESSEEVGWSLLERAGDGDEEVSRTDVVVSEWRSDVLVVGSAGEVTPWTHWL